MTANVVLSLKQREELKLLTPKEYANLSEYKKLKYDLTEDEFAEFISGLTDIELIDLMYDLEWQGRPNQQLPPGNWGTWSIQAGRGNGKTFTGSKCVNKWAKENPGCRIALVGADIGEVLDVMILGESGMVALSRPDFKLDTQTHVNKTKCIVTYPNGSIATGYSGKEPESLRGPNNSKAWVDELFKYRYQREVWDELMMTMRSGNNPQVLVTSTPRPTALCKEIASSKHTVVTYGSTYDNAELSERFLEQTIKQYEGTRRGRQELLGEILDDNPGALFKQELIDKTRVDKVTHRVNGTDVWDDDDKQQWIAQMDRIVVGVDPATTSNEETSDATGLLICGRKDNDGYVFNNGTTIATPNEWAQKAIDFYKEYQADRVVAEVNQGGDMVEAIIRNIDPNVSYKKVHATRGKAIRAEPIAALYEQGRIHHIGYLPELEDEMCQFDPALGRNQKSPNAMDGLVWAFTELFGESIKTPSIHYL